MDRTSEFLQLVRGLSSAGGVGGKGGGKVSNPIPKTRTAFHEAAADIARGVHRTSGKFTYIIYNK